MADDLRLHLEGLSGGLRLSDVGVDAVVGAAEDEGMAFLVRELPQTDRSGRMLPPMSVVPPDSFVVVLPALEKLVHLEGGDDGVTGLSDEFAALDDGLLHIQGFRRLEGFLDRDDDLDLLGSLMDRGLSLLEEVLEDVGSGLGMPDVLGDPGGNFVDLTCGQLDRFGHEEREGVNLLGKGRYVVREGEDDLIAARGVGSDRVDEELHGCGPFGWIDCICIIV